MGWLWVFLSGDSDYVDDKSLAEAEKLKSQREERVALEVKADEDTLSYFGADARDNLTDIVKRRTIKLENGFSCFPDGDPLTESVKKVKPLKSYYDVAMHGSPTAVAFGSKKPICRRGCSHRSSAIVRGGTGKTYG